MRMVPSMFSGSKGVALVRASKRREAGSGDGGRGVIFLDLVLGYLMPLGLGNDLGGTGRKRRKGGVENKEAAKSEK